MRITLLVVHSSALLVSSLLLCHCGGGMSACIAALSPRWPGSLISYMSPCALANITSCRFSWISPCLLIVLVCDPLQMYLNSTHKWTRATSCYCVLRADGYAAHRNPAMEVGRADQQSAARMELMEHWNGVVTSMIVPVSNICSYPA